MSERRTRRLFCAERRGLLLHKVAKVLSREEFTDNGKAEVMELLHRLFLEMEAIQKKLTEQSTVSD